MDEGEARRQHSMEDLLLAAKERGYAPTRRMVQDWVELGLLDRPERRGRGRGKGVSATWSEEQLQLFLTLLDKRQQVKRVAMLANVPTWLWLYFGDGFVPLQQLREALKTWSGRTSKGSLNAGLQAARQLLADVGHPQAKRADRERLVSEAARMLSNLPTRFDEAALLPLLQPVCNPEGTHMTRTLGGMEARPEAVLGIIAARVRAQKALEEGKADDALFHWARYVNVVSRAGYQAQLTRMAGASFARASVPTAQDLVLRSCLDLLTLIGLGLRERDPLDQSLDNPAVWRARHLLSVVQGQQDGNAVIVTVEVQPGPEHASGQ